MILVSAVLLLSCGQTDKQTETQATDADDRLTHATTVGVSNMISRDCNKIFHDKEEEICMFDLYKNSF